ncbi:MAG: hypothetical protein MUE41_07415 [Gemmatimonadaceae bacterium]|jgi:hypothetical protein|nr:hypothetical protein [Gemmatimonadaceae bacterium]
MNRTLPATLLLAGALVSACADRATTTDPDPREQQPAGIAAGTLEVAISGATLTLRNTTGQVVTYRAIEGQTITLALFPACTVPTCPSLQPGETRRVPLSEVLGWREGAREVIVPWWRMILGRDGALVPSLPGESARLIL